MKKIAIASLFACLLLIIKGNAQSQTVTFSSDKVVGCKPLTVNYTNTSTVGVSYKWYFYMLQLNTVVLFDSASTRDATYTYTLAGTYYIYLYAYNSSGADIGSFYSINDVEGGYNYFLISADTICPGDNVTFQGLALYDNMDTQYQCYWSFGDGDTASQVTTPNQQAKEEHVYTATGNYKVVLVIISPCGTDTIVQHLVVNNNPVPPLTKFYFYIGALGVVCPNTQIQFVPYSVPNFTPSTYLWDFGDGTSADTASNPYHSYSSTGAKLVTLTVGNNCGNTSSFTDTLFVTDTITPATPYFQPYPGAACPGDEVLMWGQGSPQDNSLSYHWTFGDGNTDTVYDPKHVYTDIGTFYIIETVTNGCGKSNSSLDSVQVTHTAIPPAQFDVLVNTTLSFSGTACPNDKLQFTPYTYSDWFIPYPPFDAASYRWDFGDGTRDTAYSPAHFYPNYGQYTVAFIVTNSCGNTDTAFASVAIDSNATPSGGFSWADTKGIFTQTVSTCEELVFTGTGGLSYQWNFGDGTILSSGSDTVMHSYTAPGNYTIQLTVANGCGNTGTVTSPITVRGVCTGINEVAVSEEETVIIYPNPFSSTATIEIKGPRFINGRMSLYNMLGQEVMNWEIRNSRSEINKNGLHAGVYIYKIYDAKSVFKTGKLVIE